MKCPKCNDQLIEIVYGLPTVEVMEMAEKGEVFLGGCCIVGGAKILKYYCKKCNKKYYDDLVEDDGKVRFE